MVPNSGKVAGSKDDTCLEGGVTNTQGTVSNQIIKDMYLNEIDEELGGRLRQLRTFLRDQLPDWSTLAYYIAARTATKSLYVFAELASAGQD